MEVEGVAEEGVVVLLHPDAAEVDCVGRESRGNGFGEGEEKASRGVVILNPHLVPDCHLFKGF